MSRSNATVSQQISFNISGDKYDLILGPMESWDLDQLMNGPIRGKLEIIPEDVTWGG